MDKSYYERVLSPDKVTRHMRDTHANKTGFIGVKYVARRKIFEAWIRVHGRTSKLYVGCAKTAEDAAKLYDAKTREIYGSGAVVNFE